MDNKIIIKNGKIVLFDRVVTGDLKIANGIITAIGKGAHHDNANLEIDASGKYVLPGFVDIHTHGINGFDLTNGLFCQDSSSFLTDEENFVKGIQAAIQKYLSRGTTRIFLATVSASEKHLKKVLGFLANYLKSQKSLNIDTPVSGVLLEGTFIKNKQFAGAQNADYFREPSIDFFDRLQAAANGHIKSVNIVPEYDAAAYELIKYLTAHNVVCGAGHTGATADQYTQAVENGLRIAIHFLNGPTGSSTKPFGHGGAIQAVLRSPEVFAELIMDGYHVDPIYLREVFQRKGLPRVIAITDSMFVTGLENIETFIVSGVLGRVSDNRQYLEVVGAENALFGSVLTMDVAFSNIVSWLTQDMAGIWHPYHSALPLHEALIQATWMCSRNPAKALHIMRPEYQHIGQDLSQFTGSLDVGKSADIVIGALNGEPGNYALEIDNVIFKGNIVQ
ncbi:amidohydrolase family protein [candidate division KSB1 bacterium]|nr:amidohydrolase family protein [candidate division KSB1 bacterium]